LHDYHGDGSLTIARRWDYHAYYVILQSAADNLKQIHENEVRGG